ncbi:hypothetical protein TGMAS_359270 [Toxoplasma gondii MAS]|uniref:Uncharacterized protein n=2 Tax=Toxoplasma gondii TaxID=5811 RepID=A0A086QR19_TOXGO|nr:hypothetical protein TGMAS_359270 [Toxoplasma gondii MAS]PUA88986.1 hypothetical protein TGBR9_359270 [Toxoplasma gondii TgCATBr9]
MRRTSSGCFHERCLWPQMWKASNRTRRSPLHLRSAGGEETSERQRGEEEQRGDLERRAFGGAREETERRELRERDTEEVQRRRHRPMRVEREGRKGLREKNSWGKSGVQERAVMPQKVQTASR